eukprot:TRINITY_DN625_c0_g1_i1.p1 TRINITY_DN625_c0_g1~~TRINITY_DN625_c0_g1_i1.p1  ORF type:complete len:1449 (+),score=370.81 TRINITY_DN625_c0_g1_i1:17-4363(+)
MASLSGLRGSARSSTGSSDHQRGRSRLSGSSGSVSGASAALAATPRSARSVSHFSDDDDDDDNTESEPSTEEECRSEGGAAGSGGGYGSSDSYCKSVAADVDDDRRSKAGGGSIPQAAAEGQPRELSEDEVALSARWVRFFASKQCLPLPLDANGQTPAQLGYAVPYCLTVCELLQIPLPAQLLQRTEAKEGITVEYRCNVSLFDTFTKKFFGNTFVGDPVVEPIEPQANYDQLPSQSLRYNQRVYFHSSVVDPKCIAVVEIVLTVKVFGVTTSEVGVGWTFVSVFGDPTRLKDRRTDRDAKPREKPIYSGTPRCLLFLSFPDLEALKMQLKLQQGFRLTYRLNTHRDFQPVSCLVKENELVGNSCVVPGLQRTVRRKHPRFPPNWSPSPYIPNPWIITPLDPPQFMPASALIVGQFEVFLSGDFEPEFVKEMNISRMVDYAIDEESDNRTVTVVEKRIVFGVHNGRTFVRKPESAVLIQQEDRLVYDNAVSFGGFVRHALYAVVFQLEFVVQLPLPASTRQNPKTPGSVERVIPVGWFPFVPFGAASSQTDTLAGQSFLVKLETGPSKALHGNTAVFRSHPANSDIFLQFQLVLQEPDTPQSEFVASAPVEPLRETFPATSMKQRQSILKDSSPRPKSPKHEDPDAMNLHSARSPYETVASVPRPSKTKATQTAFEQLPLFTADDGKPLEEVATFTTSHIPLKYDVELDVKDRLCKNEVRFLFMAYSYPEKAEAPQGLKSVFFTFQFWKYPFVVTDTLTLNEPDGSGVHVLYPSAGGKPGMVVNYYGQGRQFLNHLYQRTMQIDVWNGDSLFHLGSVNVELKHLLRQGKPGVQVTDCYEITKELRTLPDASVVEEGAKSRTVCTGYLHLRMANIGSVSDRPDLYGMVSSTSVAQQRLHNVPSFDPVTAKPLPETEEELALLLQQLKPQPVPSNNIFAVKPDQMGDLERQHRQRARVQLINQRLGKAYAPEMDESQREREQELQVIQSFRERRKPDVITHKLREYLTTAHTIYPSFGAPSFFEFAFTNPYDYDHAFSFASDDAELKIVTNLEEQRILKRHFDVTSPTAAIPLEEGTKVKIRPKETISVPFKFLSMHCGHIVPKTSMPDNVTLLENPLGTLARDEAVARRSITVSISNQRGVVVAYLRVAVEPQPFAVDHTFWFDHFESDLFTQSIKLTPRYDSANQPGIPVKYVVCSSAVVAHGTHSRKSETDPQEIYFRVRCGPTPEILRFYFLLYDDPQCVSLYETWQVFVRSVKRHDITAQAGQTTQGSLPIHGTGAHRMVQCFSSHPDELQVDSTPMTLMTGCSNEVFFKLLPLRPGKKEIYVHAVDVEQRRLAHAWVLCLCASRPTVVSFCTTANIGGPHSFNKKVEYTNPFAFEKVVLLRVNEPHLARFKESTATLQAKETVKFILMYYPQAPPLRFELLVYVNDADTDKTIDCISIDTIVS